MVFLIQIYILVCHQNVSWFKIHQKCSSSRGSAPPDPLAVFWGNEERKGVEEKDRERCG